MGVGRSGGRGRLLRLTFLFESERTTVPFGFEANPQIQPRSRIRRHGAGIASPRFISGSLKETINCHDPFIY